MTAATFVETLDAPLFPAGRALYSAIELAPKPVRNAAHAVEQAVEVPLLHCRECGDCSLPDIAYVRLESGCAKNQRKIFLGRDHHGAGAAERENDPGGPAKEEKRRAV